MRYNVDFEYMIPQFSTITLDAEDDVLAQEQAEAIVLQQNPEAIDLIFMGIEEVID